MTSAINSCPRADRPEREPSIRRSKSNAVEDIHEVRVPAGLRCRVFAISDLHADHEKNLSWLARSLPARGDRTFDVCIVAGDVSEKLSRLRRVLATLRLRFDEVCYVVGNHELWLKQRSTVDRLLRSERASDSVDKLQQVLDLCAEHRVRCGPLWLRETSSIGSSTPEGGVLVFPLMSWHHSDWDEEPDLPNESADMIKGTPDYHLCSWPETIYPRHFDARDPRPVDGGRGLASWFATLNEPPLKALLTPDKDSRKARLPLAAEYGRPPPKRSLTEAETYQHLSMDATPQAPFLSDRLGGLRLSDVFRRRLHKTGGREESTPVEVIPGFTDEPDEGRPFVVSFSHFVPRQELLPEKRVLLHGSLLPKVSGSSPLEAQIRRLQPDVHLFGHTHINVDVTIEGVRYVQWALGNPKEREQGGPTRLAARGGFFCVFDGTTSAGEAPEHWTALGAHHRDFERDPERLTLGYAR